MIRISANLYRLTADRFGRRVAGQWYLTDGAGATLDGPFGNVLDLSDRYRKRARERRRRTSILDRIVTVRDGDDAMTVRVMSPTTGEPIPARGSVRRIDGFQGYTWQASTGSGGRSPLYVAAILATAHAIDESELS